VPTPYFRTVVDYPTVEPPGTIIIDTPNTYLYLTLGHGKATRYGIGVGREGFTWSGTEHISQRIHGIRWPTGRIGIGRWWWIPRRRPAIRRVKLVVWVFVRNLGIAVRIRARIARRTSRIGIGRWWCIARRWRLRRRILRGGTAD
jgi:hypothetical protein